MSWSVNAFGKPQAVAAKLATEFAKITYLTGPEAGLKDAAAEIVAKALEANTNKTSVVKVDCSGSGSNHPADGSAQTLKIEVSPIWGFTE